MSENILGLDIVISHSKNSKELRKKGYAVLSADGGAYTESITVPTINIYSLRYDLKAKDYQASTLGFKFQLSKNKVKILNFFKELVEDFGAPKIAFVGKGDKYCFRFLLATYFLNSIVKDVHGAHIKSVKYIDGSSDDFESVAYTNQYYVQAMEMEDSYNYAEIVEKLQTAYWTFAKTMPNNPHEYTLRKNWYGDFPNYDFLRVATYLRMFGEFEEFGGSMWRILKIGNYKYWCCAFDYTNDKVDLINRAKL